MAGVELQGRCDSRFAPLREALAENFASRGELGAAVAVVLEGELVADLWGGWADEARTRPWRRDTLVDGFSVGKAMVALCALQLAEGGRLDLDAPVARLWPEFAAAGKEGITTRTILAHRAGLPAIREVVAASSTLHRWEPTGPDQAWDQAEARLRNSSAARQ